MSGSEGEALYPAGQTSGYQHPGFFRGHGSETDRLRWKAASPKWPADWPNDNEFNTWTKDTKIKTAKCGLCSIRVKIYSWQCSRCRKRICSECAEPNGISRDIYKQLAINNLGKVCNCFYPGGTAPENGEIFSALSRPNTVVARDKKVEDIAAATKTTKQASPAVEKEMPPTTKLIARQSRSNAPSDRPTSDTTLPGPPKRKAVHWEDGDSHNRLIDWRKKVKASVVPEPITRALARWRPAGHDEQVPRSNSGATTNNADPGFVLDPYYQALLDDFFAGRPLMPRKLARRGATIRVGKPERAIDVTRRATPRPVAPHLRKGHTVIVGAGIVGLFVATQLATDLERNGIKHHITVVDVRNGYCQLASGHSAGILTERGLPEGCIDLVWAAERAWEDMKEFGNFTKRTEFGHETLFTSQLGQESDHDTTAPSWWPGDSTSTFRDDSDAIGVVNASKLAAYTYKECKRLRVKFLFHHCVTKTFFSPTADIAAIDVQDVTERDPTSRRLPCTNLVLAAGPFTTHIFRDLYPDSPLRLANHIQSSVWFQVPRADTPEGGTTAVTIADAAAHEPKLLDRVTVTTHAKVPLLTISGVRTRGAAAHVPTGDALRDPERKGRTRELRAAAAPFLPSAAAAAASNPTAAAVTAGSCTIGTAAGGRPVIARVPSAALGLATPPPPPPPPGDAAPRRPCGVWLSYGFGLHGTLLAPVAAKALVAQMFGGAAGFFDSGAYELSGAGDDAAAATGSEDVEMAG